VLDVDGLALGRARHLELLVVQHDVLARAHLEALDHLAAIDLAPVGIDELVGRSPRRRVRAARGTGPWGSVTPKTFAGTSIPAKESAPFQIERGTPG
jgi:hypothetical protein